MHKAQQALDRIVSEPSELLELWQESEDGDKWRDAVRELRARLDGAPAR
ncbi:conserved hypothethical protein (plasmid) [Ralstonia solanacearum CMR15]|nr:conserved hypothethical protein [Ralstonia solanacearum CMR15]